jgi:alkanesulfonate monooxygenase SsuD/methylene tetrahydromethanopterin reductase-like flavin-dependent oxidoreductase (luciferase family)
MVPTGCNVCCTPLAKDDGEVEDLVDKFHAAVAAHPEMPRPKLMMLRHALLVEREEEVEDAARAVREWFGHFERWVRNDGSAREGRVEPVGAAELQEKPAYALDAVRANALVGTPEQVIRRLERYRDLGIDEVGLWTDFPRSYDVKRRSVELCAEHVLPAFSEVHAPA